MENRHDIENFNKKAIYILIREMADVDTSQITKVANVLRKKYQIIIKQYNSNGHISKNSRINNFF